MSLDVSSQTARAGAAWIRVMAVAAAMVGLATPALADSEADRKRAAELASEGSAFGRAGDFEQAIAKFAAAERIYPRALHNCNMGLAYARIDLTAPAHFFLVECRERWAGEEQGALPVWVGKRIAEAEAKLKAGDYATVALTTTPSEATIVVPGLTEQGFHARTVWLTAGDHEVRVTHAGFEAVTRTITVRAGQAAQVELVLPPTPTSPTKDEVPVEVAPVVQPSIEGVEASPATAAGPGPAHDRAANRRARPWLAWSTLALGVGLAATGAVFHVRAMDAKDEAGKYTADDASFTSNNDTYERRRLITLSLYGLGAAGVAVGTYLLVKARGSSSGPAVGAVIGSSGGGLLVRWEM